MEELLNQPQRNSLTIALRMLEERLRQAAVWLQDDPDEGILYRRTIHLPSEARIAAQQGIAMALSQITQLVRDLGLQPQEERLESTISAAMNLSWANLCDVRSDKLKRYGPVAPRLAEALDPRIDTLAELTLSLALLFGRQTPEG